MTVCMFPFRRKIQLLARAAVALEFAMVLLAPSQPPVSAAGKWTPNYWDWRSPTQVGRDPVHLILLPGDGAPYHSRILWWHREFSTLFEGG